MDDQELQQHVLYKIGTRTVLLLGCERKLVLFLATIIAGMIFAVKSFVGGAIILLGGFIALYFLRMMAKSDPLLSEVYIRHRQYKPLYLAHATHFGINNHKYK